MPWRAPRRGRCQAIAALRHGRRRDDAVSAARAAASAARTRSNAAFPAGKPAQRRGPATRCGTASICAAKYGCSAVRGGGEAGERRGRSGIVASHAAAVRRVRGLARRVRFEEGRVPRRHVPPDTGLLVDQRDERGALRRGRIDRHAHLVLQGAEPAEGGVRGKNGGGERRRGQPRAQSETPPTAWRSYGRDRLAASYGCSPTCKDFPPAPTRPRRPGYTRAMADVIASEYRLATEKRAERVCRRPCSARSASPRDDAAIAADVLVAADMRGVESHGVARLEAVLRQPHPCRAARAVPSRARRCNETPTSVLVDAGNGLGHPAAKRTMDRGARQGAGRWARRSAPCATRTTSASPATTR